MWEYMLNRDFFASAEASRLHKAFVEAEPFPHLVLENLFDAKVLDAIHGEFDALGRDEWISYDNANEVKFGSRPNTRLGAASQAYFDTLHRGEFVGFLSAISGIAGLVPDPFLRGGGLHEIPTGGMFKVHTDFNRHADTKLDNRLVVITYLNRDWDASYGGALELWTKEARVREVLPTFGRTIIFNQSSRSYHGHPVPVSAPDGRPRRSIAAYFYTNGRPDASPAERVSTQFLHAPPSRPGLKQRAKQTIKYFTPPALIDGLKAGRQLFR